MRTPAKILYAGAGTLRQGLYADELRPVVTHLPPAVFC